MSVSAKARIDRRRVPLRDFVQDICLCQGPGERVRCGDLWLYLCGRCGKATHERGVRAGDAGRRIEAGRR